MLRSFAGGSVFGAAWGSEPRRILALHGWGRTHEDFAAALGSLPAVAPDLPGFGATPPPPEPWGSVDYASSLVPLFTEGDLVPPVVVVGHSFGGRVAIQLAASMPERVGALVLTGVPLIRPDPAAAPRRPPLAYRVVRSLARAGLVSDARLERARDRHGSSDYRRAQGVMRGVLVRTVGEQYSEPLASVASTGLPVEMVWGEDDTETPPAIARQLAGWTSATTVTFCPDAGHLLPTTAPAALRDAVQRALSRLAPCS